MERIVVRRAAEQPLEYTLYGDRTRIGSDPWNEISLPAEEGVAGCHAELLKSPSGCFIIDLDSPGGTFVNGAKIKEKELRDGDRVGIGCFTLVCLSAGSPFAAAALEPEPEAPAAPPRQEPVPEPAAPQAEEILQPAAAEIPAAPPAEPAAEPVPEPAGEAQAGQPAVQETPSEAVPAEAEPQPEQIYQPGTAEPAGEPAAEIASAPEPALPADENEATLVLPRRGQEPAEEAAPAEPAQEPAAEQPAAPAPVEDAPDRHDEAEATFILQRRPETPAPEAVPESPAPAARGPAPADPPPGAEDRFAITSIMKVPKKRPSAAPAAQELEEGVIEIEVRENPAWSGARVRKIATLAGAAACLLAGVCALRSPGLRAALLPPTELRFSVEPADAQVFVNGARMPRPGAGVLRNLPPGRFSVKVSHPSYPTALAAEVETGLFRRRAVIAASPEGITAK